MEEKYTKEYFKGKVLVLNTKEHLDKVINDLGGFEDRDKLVNFPMIVYEDRYAISISEIDKSNLLKLKFDKYFSRDIIEIT